ncbi:ATP-dependent RecD-like DNA helicase [Mesorhizobium sp. M0293]|uniref:AAA family ATPase n=1 Tax=Mesorhizobium sp. M0293 TaxID=2956930 RepID=UPI00333A32EE
MIAALPKGRHVVDFLASRPEFVGIGKATAKRLWERFGEELYAILGNGAYGRLSEVLQESHARIVVDAWRNQQAVVDCVVFFDEHGIDPKVARKAVEFWGEEAVQKIRSNPYRLLTVCKWEQVDRTARALGIAAEDERRLVARVESVLYDRLDRKHTWSPQGLVMTMTARRLGANGLAAAAVRLAVEDGAAIPVADGYQPAGAAYMERFIEGRVRCHIDAKGNRGDLFLGNIGNEQIDAFLAKFGRSQANPLTDEQVAAVRMVLSNTFSMLVGGAGVGKTTALRAINAASRSFGFKVYQLAVAGRAAQRMAQATGQPAQTIASWLAAARDGRIEVGAHTLVIVDEASMLDLPTLYRILFCLPENAPLLLVGDIAQLPPIGFGLTLHKLVECSLVPKSELTKILRADEATGIPKVSSAIRLGEVVSLPRYSAARLGCSLLPGEPDAIVDIIEDVLNDLQGEDVQIVAASYAGPAGIDAINRRFHSANARGRPTFGQFAHGDPCIWTVNDYDRHLWNGSLGRVVRIGPDWLTAEFDGVAHNIGRADLDRIELAYCISVHKAQGSQFANVIMPVTPSFNFDRTMLYTGLTRAVSRVVLVGSKTVLARAISDQPRSLDRDVALDLSNSVANVAAP